MLATFLTGAVKEDIGSLDIIVATVVAVQHLQRDLDLLAAAQQRSFFHPDWQVLQGGCVDWHQNSTPHIHTCGGSRDVL